MNKHALSAVLVAGLAGLACAGQARAVAPGQAQIEEVITRFKTAIVAHDQKGLEALFVPEGGSWFEVLGEDAYHRIKARKPGLSRVHADSYRHFAALMGGAKQAVEEKFDNVRIHTDGAVASVYFDYVFLIDGKRNNVGSETWQLVHTNDGWKISAMAYSSYPDRAR